MKKTCEKHGEYESEIVEIFGVKIESRCPLCEKEQEEAEQKLLEEKRQKAQYNDLIRRGIEPEFFNAKLTNYQAETKSEKDALKAACDIAEGKCKKVLILGSNGTGKTHLACALVMKMGGIRITMYELSAKIRQGYTNGTGELETLNNLLSYPFIALDEIGRTKGSDAELNWLSYLIDKAHTRGIPLMLISNKHQAKNLPKDRWNEAIENYLPNDAISRLRQNTVIVEVEGRDRRAATMAAV